MTDYLSKISEQMAMKVSAVIQVVETGHVQAFQDDFRLRKPDLEVKVIVVVSWEYGIVEFRDYPNIRLELFLHWFLRHTGSMRNKMKTKVYTYAYICIK